MTGGHTTPLEVAYQTARLRLAAAVNTMTVEGWPAGAILYALLTMAPDVGRRLCAPDEAAEALCAARDAIATGRQAGRAA